ncbi:MAG: hypothetical protein HY907_05395 [Deltaproteobacteria bacterium]|nr:hypothetical protein [Deltaproteobacteria bacterium]
MYDSGHDAPAPARTLTEGRIEPHAAAALPVPAGAVRTVPPTEVLPAAGGVFAVPSAVRGEGPVPAGERPRGLVAALIVALVVVVAATVALSWYFATRGSRRAGAGAAGGASDAPEAAFGPPEAGADAGVGAGAGTAGSPASDAGTGPVPGPPVADGGGGPVAAAGDGRALYVAVTVDVGCRMIEQQAAHGVPPAADEQQRIIDAVLAARGSDRVRYGVLAGRFQTERQAASEVERGTAACMQRFFGTGAAPADAGATDEAAERALYVAITAEVTCGIARGRDGGGAAPGEQALALVQGVVASHGTSLVEYGRLSERYGKEPEVEAEVARRMNECMARADGGADGGPEDEAAARRSYIEISADQYCLPIREPQGEQTASPMERACAAHGVAVNRYVGWAQRFGDDSAVQAEISARIDACTRPGAPAARP